MNVLMFSPGYPAEMPYFTRGLAQVGARALGLGDQPPRDAPRGRPRGSIGLLVGGQPVRRGGGDRRGPALGTAGLDRPRRVPVGAGDAARRPPARGPRSTRDDCRRDRAVPRQVGDEGSPRPRRHPHPAPCPLGDRPGGAGGGGADRLPAVLQADRRRRLGGYLPHRRRGRPRADPAAPASRRRGQRRRVHRRRGVHLRHHLRRRPGAVLPTSPGTGRSRLSAAPKSGSAPRPSPCATSRQPISLPASRWVTRCSKRSATVPGSPRSGS